MSETGYLPLRTDDLQLLTAEQAWHYRIVPKGQSAGALSFFIDSNTSLPFASEQLEMLFGKEIILEPVAPELIQNSLGKYYRQEQQDSRIKSLVFSGNSEDFFPILSQKPRALAAVIFTLRPMKTAAG